MKTMSLRKFIIFSMLGISLVTSANDYIIYSIVQNVPMSHDDTTKKNFYINMGEKQGIRPGTVLDVLRNINRSDPYETKKRYSYNVKIAELKIIHAEDNAAIGSINEINNKSDDPLFEIENVMIGDKVSVKISD